MDRQELGRNSEESAASFLKKQGCRILARNFHTRWGELDIVAMDGNTLVFVEVRARTESDFLRPEESVTPTKQEHLKKAAELWLLDNYPTKPPVCRFDVISVTFDEEGKSRIEHFPDAFQ